MRSNIGTQRFRRHQINGSAKEFFEKKGKVDIVIISFFIRLGFDEQIDVALKILAFMQERAE